MCSLNMKYVKHAVVVLLLTLCMVPPVAAEKDHLSLVDVEKKDPQQEIASIFKELAEVAAVKDRAVAKVKLNLRRIHEIDAKKASLDRDIEDHNKKVEQNKGNCRGQYKEPDLSYWMKFCSDLQKKGDELDNAQEKLSDERYRLIKEAKNAEAKYDAAEKRTQILLAKLRVNRILSQNECDGCSESKTIEAQVACYQVCWDKARDPGFTVPTPYDSDPSVVKPYRKKSIIPPSKRVFPGQLLDAVTSLRSPSREEVTGVVLDALTVGNRSWYRTLAYIRDALVKYPDNQAITQGAARLLGMAELTPGNMELWKSLADEVLMPLEQESFEYTTWSLIKQAEAKQDLALAKMIGGVIQETSLREAEAALRLLQRAQQGNPNNHALRIMVNYWEGMCVNWYAQLVDELHK